MIENNDDNKQLIDYINYLERQMFEISAVPKDYLEMKNKDNRLKCLLKRIKVKIYGIFSCWF
jgi:hypothetical protein